MEIFGFSPDDIDREEVVANIQRQIRWIGHTPVFAPPKGGKTRVVPIGAGVLEEIDAHLDSFEPVTVTLPWLEPGGRPETARLLIRKPKGLARLGARAHSEVTSGPEFNRAIWRPAYVTAGLDYVPRRDGMHGMRHFYASIALASGVSVKELAEYLGHHDPGYTLRIYTHLVPSSHRPPREPRLTGSSNRATPGRHGLKIPRRPSDGLTRSTATKQQVRPYLAYLCQNLTPLHVTVIGPAPLDVR
jgi:integrase